MNFFHIYVMGFLLLICFRINKIWVSFHHTIYSDIEVIYDMFPSFNQPALWQGAHAECGLLTNQEYNITDSADLIGRWNV